MKVLVKLFIPALVFCVLSGCSEKGLEAKKEIKQDGKTIVVNNLELNVISKDTRREVKPLKPYGYYPHYKEKEGYHYHVLYGTLKNIGEKDIDVNKIKVEGISDDSYQGKLVLINEVQSYFLKEIGPGGQLEFYVFSLVKNGDNPKKYHFYYDNDGKIKKDQIKFDVVVKYDIPKSLKTDKKH